MKKIIGIVILVLLIINNVSAQDLIGHLSEQGQITLDYQPPAGGTGLVYSVTWNWFYYDGSDSESNPSQKTNAAVQFVIHSTDVKDYVYVDGKQYSKADVTLVNKQYPKGYSWETHVSRVHFAIKTDYGSSGTHGTLDRSYKHAYDPDFDGFYFVTAKTIASKPLPFPGMGNPQIISNGEGTYELKNVLRLKQEFTQKTTNSSTPLNQARSNTSVSNPNTTNNTNSNFTGNNTVQENSKVTNINLKKNKSVEYTNKGNQFYSNGSYDEAEMYWEKALKLDPNNQAAKNNITQLKNIQNSNAQIMAQSQQQTNNFNSQQQNIQQSSENIANNLVDGSPNAVGQAGVATAKLLAESGAGYAESMLGGAGVVALGALLNGGGKSKPLGLTGENITKEYKNATYVGGFYDGKFDGNMKVTFKNGIQLERTSVRKPGVSDYETIIIVPNTCKGKVHCLFKNNRVKMNTPKNYLQTLLIPLRNYKSELKYFNGDKYVGRFYHSNSHLFVGGEYSFANGKIVQINSLWADLAFKSAKVTFKNGNTIEGKFIEMIREGKSTYTWTDNDKYKCKFDEGKRIGKLDLTFNNGDVFHTNYKDNTFSKGTYKQSNGEVLSISIDRIIEEELNEIPQSNLFKILLIAYEDMLNTENNKKAP